MKLPNALRYSTRFGSGLVVFLTLFLSGCPGGGDGVTPPPSNYEYGWVLIEKSTVKSDASVYFYGRAFSDTPTPYTPENCPEGPDTSMTVKWTNQTSGTSGYGLLIYWVGYNYGGPTCEHRWTATVPLVSGNNTIVIKVSGTTDSGSTSIDVQGPLVVSSTIPLSNTTNVPVNSTISATFNGQIDPQTVTSSSFILSSPYGTQTGSLAVNGSTVTFTPDSYLYGNTTYTATITTAVKDINGIAATNYTWIFTDGLVLDATPPTVSSTSPTNNATGVAVNSAITATFSEPMMASTISAATFTLNNGVTGTVTYSGTIATFTPSTNLAYSTSYTATITTGVRDAAANAMSAPYTWTFTTGIAPDTTPPAVLSTNPSNGATGVAVHSEITATFSEKMAATTLTSATFTLSNGVTGTVTCSGITATFTPTSFLTSSTAYTATITTGAIDAKGNAMDAPYTWTFTTAAPDTTPPSVLSTSPTNGAAGVAAYPTITATFSEPMNASTVTTATFTLNNGITGTVTYSGSTATFTPASILTYPTTYTATITTGVKDLAGNAMAADYTWTFSLGTPGAYFKMPDTNQTLCYDTSRTAISCAGTGQDGDYIINPPSFTDNGDGTIMDNVTGLVWQKQNDATARAWDNAITYCSNLTLAGQTGWRLPSRIELISIVDYGVYYPDPAINVTFFPGTNSSNYWSSSSNWYGYYYPDAWYVDFGSGQSDVTSKTSSNYVRCVRGGQ